MDLNDLNPAKFASRPQWLQLKHPVTDEPLFTEDGDQIRIQLIGRDAPAYRQFIRNVGNRAMKKRGTNQTMESMEEQSSELLAVATVGWENIMLGGEALEFSQANVVQLYQEHPWIREQVDVFVQERDNFLT